MRGPTSSSWPFLDPEDCQELRVTFTIDVHALQGLHQLCKKYNLTRDHMLDLLIEREYFQVPEDGTDWVVIEGPVGS